MKLFSNTSKPCYLCNGLSPFVLRADATNLNSNVLSVFMESGGTLQCSIVEVVLSEIRLGINVGFIVGYFDLTIYGLNFFFNSGDKFCSKRPFSMFLKFILIQVFCLYFFLGLHFICN